MAWADTPLVLVAALPPLRFLLRFFLAAVLLALPAPFSAAVAACAGTFPSSAAWPLAPLSLLSSALAMRAYNESERGGIQNKRTGEQDNTTASSYLLHSALGAHISQGLAVDGALILRPTLFGVKRQGRLRMLKRLATGADVAQSLGQALAAAGQVNNGRKVF